MYSPLIYKIVLLLKILLKNENPIALWQSNAINLSYRFRMDENITINILISVKKKIPITLFSEKGTGTLINRMPELNSPFPTGSEVIKVILLPSSARQFKKYTSRFQHPLS